MLQILPDLSIVQGLKAARNAKKPLDPLLFAACVLGHRVATTDYVTKVSKWIRDGTNEMAHALPPSVKFQSCCTKSEVHAILDGIWISEYQNTVSCMKHAVRTVQKSKWKLYSFDERATWQSRKDVADADAAKKDNAKGKTSPAVEFVDVTDALILHELIRRHAIVCKTRSTYGRFVPVLRR